MDRLSKITPLPPSQFKLEWSNGEVQTPAYFAVRMACPCAACVDEHTGAKLLRPESVPLDVRPLGIDPIGHYALRIRWSDGHQTGLYSFELLHAVGGAHPA